MSIIKRVISKGSEKKEDQKKEKYQENSFFDLYMFIHISLLAITHHSLILSFSFFSLTLFPLPGPPFR